MVVSGLGSVRDCTGVAESSSLKTCRSFRSKEGPRD